MRLAPVVATVALLVPATAAASTATVTEHLDRVPYSALSYVAEDGEANDLLVQGDANSIVLTDPGAEIEPGPGCAPAGDHSVTCTSDPGFPFEPVFARLGDEEDRFTSEGPSFAVDGGADKDVLDGGAAGGSFQGGDGDDVLEGGAHGSSFRGGDGADTMIGTDEHDHFLAGPGPDTMDGGGQLAASALGDTVNYRYYARPVTIDLSKPVSTAGPAGEGDTISNFENALGGAGADTITARQDVWSPLVGSVVSGGGGGDVIQGGPSDDDLHGMGGDDTIRGAGGDDHISGGRGGDALLGEAGSNTLRGVGAPGDLADCGDGGTIWPGFASRRLQGVIDQSCRRVRFEYVPITRLRYRYDGRPTRAVATVVVCDRRCLVTVALRRRGEVLGTATREIGPGDRGTLTVPLGDDARAELAEAGTLKLRFSMDVKWGAGLHHEQAGSWGLRLHDPPAAR